VQAKNIEILPLDIINGTSGIAFFFVFRCYFGRISVSRSFSMLAVMPISMEIGRLAVLYG